MSRIWVIEEMELTSLGAISAVHIKWMVVCEGKKLMMKKKIYALSPNKKDIVVGIS